MQPEVFTFEEEASNLVETYINADNAWEQR